MSIHRDIELTDVYVRAEGTVWVLGVTQTPGKVVIHRVEDMPARLFNEAFLRELEALAVAKLRQYGELVAA